MDKKEEFAARLIGNLLSSNSKKAYTLSRENFYGEKSNEKISYSFCEGFFLFRYKGMKVYSGKKFLSESEILSKFTKIDKRFLEKYKVYKNLREKGFILKSGSKYGADFSVYEKGKKPGRAHSTWLLSCINSSEKIKWQEFILKNRVANSTKKQVLLAVNDDEGNAIYYEVNWKKV
ncbi:tRNA-intron lyase [Candidatus Pacearchaeota archaeon]|nr:hypothetical protein [uncultured archaeon]MBS3084393.1 tRNA-intron lyase [Candidatus Pacearchaeota archaeon]